MCAKTLKGKEEKDTMRKRESESELGGLKLQSGPHLVRRVKEGLCKSWKDGNVCVCVCIHWSSALVKRNVSLVA